MNSGSARARVPYSPFSECRRSSPPSAPTRPRLPSMRALRACGYLLNRIRCACAGEREWRSIAGSRMWLQRHRARPDIQ